MTSEERNVLLFIALGVVIGVIAGEWMNGAVSPRAFSAGPDSAGPVVVDLFPIDLNRAGPEILEQLPGIGPVRARQILELRASRGRIGSVEELAEIRGIGPKTLARLRDLVTVGEADTAAATAAAEPDATGEGKQRAQRPPGDFAARARGRDARATRTGEEAAEVDGRPDRRELGEARADLGR